MENLRQALQSFHHHPAQLHHRVTAPNQSAVHLNNQHSQAVCHYNNPAMFNRYGHSVNRSIFTCLTIAPKNPVVKKRAEKTSGSFILLSCFTPNSWSIVLIIYPDSGQKIIFRIMNIPVVRFNSQQQHPTLVTPMNQQQLQIYHSQSAASAPAAASPAAAAAAAAASSTPGPYDQTAGPTAPTRVQHQQQLPMDLGCQTPPPTTSMGPHSTGNAPAKVILNGRTISSF